MNVTIRFAEATDNLTLAAIIRAAFIEFSAPLTGTVYEDPTTDELFGLFAPDRKSVV